METKRKDVESVIKEFNKKYPRPGLEPIAIKGEYDLAIDWPQTYPSVKSAGVYIFLDGSDNLLYIGKASCKNTFGYRFGSYFKYGEDGKYRATHEYYANARKILPIPLPDGHEFEAGAIEEYLIRELKPPLNKQGT
jgi:hypothetical protein